jgi:Enoyl-CoA hydratase/isomerase
MTLTSYNSTDGIATITMDDGKVNALSPEMLAEIVAQVERAEKDGAIVVLTRARQTFSAGFDVGCEQERWREMVAAGASLAERMMSFPTPVVVACNGERDRNGGVSLALCRPSRRSAGPVPNRAQLGRDRADDSVVRHRDRSPPPHATLLRPLQITGTLLGPEEAKTAGFPRRNRATPTG